MIKPVSSENIMDLWRSISLFILFGLSSLDERSLISALDSTLTLQQSQSTSSSNSLEAKLLDRCCQVGRERAIESSKFNCKLGAREALVWNSNGETGTSNTGSSGHKNQANLLALTADSLISRDANFADQCEMVLESCCMAFHRRKNCDSGKQFAKSGSSCLEVELSKEATMATESFNDCCMACSLGILSARNSNQTEPQRPQQDRCKLISHLASTLSGQMYEQTYTECCQENLPRPSSALYETGKFPAGRERALRVTEMKLPKS